jgi:iron complex outermembrane receptor protein
MRIRRRTLVTALGAILPAVGAAPCAMAQDDSEEVLEEIVVTGTRTLTRTIASSPVPIDVFKGDEVRNIGTTDMDDVLRTLVPAYNVQRFPLDDEVSLIRPATLRGLPPDNTLVLVNGKRRHRGSVLAGGSQGVDISTIPAIAVERVEVLRDGAAAQYGSDAIAGVINFITRSADDGLMLEARTGQFYEGDGQSNRLSAHVGMPLTDSGALNLSLEYGNTDSTTRSEQRFDARALQDLGATGIPDPVQTYGQPIIDSDIKFFANAVVDIGESSELYGFGNYSVRDAAIQFFWRNPNSLPNVYNQGPNRFVLDLTPDMSGNCPTAGSPNAIPVPNRFFPTQEEFDANEIALAGLAADPNCFAFNEIYPNGFRPDYGADIEDWSTVVGFRGERDSGVRYDFSAAYGRNDIDYFISNTLNPSLGPDSPTSFRPGSNVQSEISLNADFVWPVEVSAFDAPLNVASGLEWRQETFETVAGEQASWLVGPYQAQGASIGSNGYPGFPPEQAGSWDRANWAAYLDLEADVTEKLLLGLAVRYEDFDDFGSTTNYKGTFRYWINDMFGVRASYSTGFRAPTPAQSNATRTQTLGFNDMLVQGGRIPPTNPVAAFYGGLPLEPEESENISVGITLQPLDDLLITADYFRIDVENGMGESPNFGLTPEDIADLIDLGVPGASDFLFVNFFVNGMDSKRDGFDIVATYNLDWERAGSTSLSLAWNRTEVDIVSMAFPNRIAAINLTGRPRDRSILTVNHNWSNFRFLARASYYSGWISGDTPGTDPADFAPVCADRADSPPNPFGTDECYGSTWMVDLEAAYTFADRYTVILGADNVFDEYPEEDFDYPDFSFGVRYPRDSPIGYNGGFWYLRLQAVF